MRVRSAEYAVQIAVPTAAVLDAEEHSVDEADAAAADEVDAAAADVVDEVSQPEVLMRSLILLSLNEMVMIKKAFQTHLMMTKMMMMMKVMISFDKNGPFLI